MLLSMSSSMLLVIDYGNDWCIVYAIGYDFAVPFSMYLAMLVMLSLVMKLVLYGYNLTMPFSLYVITLIQSHFTPSIWINLFRIFQHSSVIIPALLGLVKSPMGQCQERRVIYQATVLSEGERNKTYIGLTATKKI